MADITAIGMIRDKRLRNALATETWQVLQRRRKGRDGGPANYVWEHSREFCNAGASSPLSRRAAEAATAEEFTLF